MKKAAAVCAAVIISYLTAYAENIHEVQKGDTLWELSGEYYGDTERWPAIWLGNVAINNPDLIRPNDKLRIPAAGGESIRLGESGLFKIEADTASDVPSASSLEPADGSNSFRTEKLNGFDVVLEKSPSFDVISVYEERAMATLGAEIIINGGKAEGIGSGDTLLIYEERSRIGKGRRVYACVAYARVVRADESSSVAEIYKAFSSVSLGFKVEKGSEVAFVRPQGYRSVNSDLEGEILYLTEDHELSAAGYTAISDIGRNFPVKEGDKFKVIRTVTEHGVSKSHVIGEGQIILLNDQFSTIYFVNTEKEIKKGDRLRLHKIAVF